MKVMISFVITVRQQRGADTLDEPGESAPVRRLLTLPQQRHQPWAGVALKFLQRGKFSEQSRGFASELVGRPVGQKFHQYS